MTAYNFPTKKERGERDRRKREMYTEVQRAGEFVRNLFEFLLYWCRVYTHTDSNTLHITMKRGSDSNQEDVLSLVWRSHVGGMAAVPKELHLQSEVQWIEETLCLRTVQVQIEFPESFLSVCT